MERIASIARNLQFGSSERPVFRQGAGDVERLSTIAWQPVWLVGGELCLFTSLPLVNIPDKHREDYVSQQIRTRSPFRETASHCEVVGDVAQIWLWDHARQRDEALRLEVQEEFRSTDLLVIPEHLLLSEEPDGLYERHVSSELVLLEKWAEGCLQSVQTTSPESIEADRVLFERSANVSGSDPRPRWQGIEPNYLHYPRHIPLWWEKNSIARPESIALIVASLCLWGLLLVFGNWLGWGAALSAVQESLESRMQQAEPELLARALYVQLQTDNEGRLEVLNVPSPIAVMAEFEFLVGEQYENVLEWRRERSRLAATIEVTGGSRRRLLEALQRSPLFSDVRVEPSARPDAVVVEATLVEAARGEPLFEQERAEQDG